MRLLFVILITGLLLTSCADDSDRAGASELPELTATEVLRIGSVDDPEEVFTAFWQLRVAPDGRIYTLHPQEHRVLVHDAQGRRVGSFGGEGEGPGEFKSPRAMGLVDESVWLLDSAGYRFLYFDLEGEHLRTVRVPIDPGRGMDERPPRPTALLSDGRIIASPPAWSRGIASGEITEQLVIVMTPEGEVGDTLARYSVVNDIIELRFEGDSRRRASYGPQPFNDGELFQVSSAHPSMVRVDRSVGPGGPRGVTVTHTTLEGDTLFTTSDLAVDTVPITDAEVDTFVTTWAQRSAEGFFSDYSEAMLREAILGNLHNPGFHPPASDLALGHDGSIWLKGPVTMDSEEAEWPVLAADGTLVGRVSLPEGFRVLDARSDQVWGQERDELDVPYIVSYEIRPADGSI